MSACTTAGDRKRYSLNVNGVQIGALNAKLAGVKESCFALFFPLSLTSMQNNCTSQIVSPCSHPRIQSNRE